MTSRSVFLVFPMIVLLAACGGEAERQDNTTWLDPAASQTTTMPEPATQPDTHAGTTVMVTLNDGHIATREAAIPPGPAVLTVVNAGKEVHNLAVEGPGVQVTTEGTLDAGETGTINVTFQQGTYTFYCPVLDHRNQGETLTVPIPTQQ